MIMVDVGGRANNEADDCSVAADFDVWNDVTLLLETNICSWKLPSVVKD